MLEVLAHDQPGFGIEFRYRRQAALEIGFHITEEARQHSDAQSGFQCRYKICEAVATDRDDGVGRHARKPERNGQIAHRSFHADDQMPVERLSRFGMPVLLGVGLAAINTP